MPAVLVVAVVSACTGGHGGPVTVRPTSPAFGGSAEKISVTSGQTGKSWWTWASSASIPTARNDAVPAQTAQRYLILDFWLKDSTAAVDKVNPAKVIAAVATGSAAQQLSDFANLGSGLAGGVAFGTNGWGFVASQTGTDASSTVAICTLLGKPKLGGTAKPSAPILADALTRDALGAWTFHLFNVDGAWRVDSVADPSPHLPASCQGWYAGLRTQAGLPAK